MVLLGHSYIRRLGEYAAGIPDGANLGLSDIQVTYVWQGGMTLRPRAGNRWIRDHLTEVYRGDELRDGWAFRVGTWNVESLTGR